MAIPKTKTDAIRRGEQLKVEGSDATKAATALMDAICKEDGYYSAEDHPKVAELMSKWKLFFRGKVIPSACEKLKITHRPKATPKKKTTKESSTSPGPAATIQDLVNRIAQLQAQLSKLPEPNVAEFAQIEDNATQLVNFMELSFKHERDPEEYEMPKELRGFFRG